MVMDISWYGLAFSRVCIDIEIKSKQDRKHFESDNSKPLNLAFWVGGADEEGVMYNLLKNRSKFSKVS